MNTTKNNMNNSTNNPRLPVLRFPEFSNEGEWEEKMLGNVCRMQAGKFVSASEIYNNAGEDFFPCYGGNGLRGYTTSFTHTGTYSLIGRQGALCGNVTLAQGKFHATEHAVVVTPERSVNTLWLFYMLNYLNLNQYATGQAQPGLSVENLEKVSLQIPKLEVEQQKIADCLSSLDELLAAEKQKLQALRAHKKGLMQQLFPAAGQCLPALRFAEFSNDGEWEIRELGEFITERVEVATEKYPLYSLTIDEGIIPKTERYERSFLVKNEEDAYKTVYPNDFAYNPMNLRFGAIARHSGINKVALSKYYNIFYCDNSVDSMFCAIYFRSSGMIAHYNDIATGTLIEKRRVHLGNFLKLKIHFPKLPEQQKIADCLSAVDELLTAQGQRIEALQAHKKGLMQGLFPSMKEEV